MKAICFGAMLALAAPLAAPQAVLAASNTTVGVGSGAVAGALVGGPVGAVAGAINHRGRRRLLDGAGRTAPRPPRPGRAPPGRDRAGTPRSGPAQRRHRAGAPQPDPGGADGHGLGQRLGLEESALTQSGAPPSAGVAPPKVRRARPG